jgi:copper(I)-binding protein
MTFLKYSLVGCVLLGASLTGVGAAEPIVLSPMTIRATAAGMPSSAAYVTITNNGDADDRLIAAKSAIARKVEIHTMEMLDGVMKMRLIEGGVPISTGEKLVLAPGGLHVMLMGLNTILAAGSQHDITLVFEKAGEVTLSATAKLPSEISSGMMTQNHEMAQ